MSFESGFSKDNLDFYLRELAKEFRKLNRGGQPIEIIIVGGAAILAAYDFRMSTLDVDCVAAIESSLKMAIQRIGERFELGYGWLNADFMRTSSFSKSLVEHSRPYRSFNHAFNVRIITGEHLVAMKLKAARIDKNDLSDIAGILLSHDQKQDPLTLIQIQKAVIELYGDLDKVAKDMWDYLENLLETDRLEELYLETRVKEMAAFSSQDLNLESAQRDNLEEILSRL